LLNSQTEVSKQYNQALWFFFGHGFYHEPKPANTHSWSLWWHAVNKWRKPGRKCSWSNRQPYAATTTLATDGWTNSITGILKAGDVITIAGVYAVNPEPNNQLVNCVLSQ